MERPAWLGSGAKVKAEMPVNVDHRSAFIGNAFLGAYTYIGRGCLIGSVRSFGRFCSLAPNVTIGLGEHPVDYLSTHPIFFQAAGMFGEQKNIGSRRTKEVISTAPVIGNDVWVGANALITRGVTVGDGAIIGANSLVNKDVPPYAIMVGSPARVLRYRFDDVTIGRLLKLKWWDYPLDLFEGVNVAQVADALEILEAKLVDARPATYPVKEFV